MHPLDVLLENVKSISNIVINKEMDNVVKALEQFIIDANVSQIYDKSIRADGKKITRLKASYPIYSKSYETYKTSINLYQGYIDLSLSGEYLKGYHLRVFPEYYEILAKERVTDKGYELSQHLRDEYGEEIEGLTDSNFTILLENFKKKFVPEIIKIVWNGV